MQFCSTPQCVKKETEQKDIFRVCFVCTGNTCRSPMAAAVANALARECGKETLRAYSAGIAAHEGDPIAENAVCALRECGVAPVSGRSYLEHFAHTLTEEEAEQFDLLVGMTAGHVMQLLMCYPNAAERIVRMPQEIRDPYGCDIETYIASLRSIMEGVRELLFSENDV